MCRQIIIARGWYAILAALVFQLPVPQPVLSGASLNVREQEVYRPLDVNPTGVSRIGDNINEALAALTNIALNEKISRFASVGGADRKLDSFEAEVSIVDGVERYSSVRGRGRTYNHVSEIRGLWSFGEIVTMLRTTRDILDATVTNREGAKIAGLDGNPVFGAPLAITGGLSPLAAESTGLILKALSGDRTGPARLSALPGVPAPDRLGAASPAYFGTSISAW